MFEGGCGGGGVGGGGAKGMGERSHQYIRWVGLCDRLCRANYFYGFFDRLQQNLIHNDQLVMCV